MREIKFRAFNESMNRMEYFGLGDTVPYYYQDEDSAPIPYNVMQYTGLRDKNGKEIYEWDIVLNHFRKQKLVVFWDNKIIGTKGGGWNYKKLENDKEMTWKIEPENIEIIGNIYENPELIKNN